MIVAAAAVGRAPSGARVPACALALAARRLVVGDASPRRARPERAAARARPLGRGHRRRHRPGPTDAAFALRVPAEVRRFDERSCASASCSSCRSAARRRRVPCSTLRATVSAPRGPRTASTSAAGWRAAASTSSSAAATGGSSAGAAGSEASPDRLRAHVARAIAPGLDGRAPRRAGGDRPGRGRGADRRAPRRLQGVGPLPPAGRIGAEHHLSRARRARARVAARHPAPPRPRCSRSPRSRRTCSPSAGSRRSFAPVSRAGWPRSPGCSRGRATAGTSSRSARRCCSPGRPRACSSPASSSRSPPSARSSCSCRASAARSRGTRCTDWLRDALAVSTACGAATAPILWLQFGSVPVYSLPANALVTLAIGPLLGLALVGSLIEPVAAVRRVRARLAERLARGVHRLRARARRRLAVRAGRVRRRGRVLSACRSLLLALQRLPRWRRRRRSRAPRRRARCSSPGSSSRTGRCRRRPGFASRSSTSVRATRSCCRCPRERSSSTRAARGRRRRPAPRRLGVHSSAALVLTHPQRDHIGGAATCCGGSGRPRPRPALTVEPARQSARRSPRPPERGVPVVRARAGDAFRLGRLRLRVLWPDGRAPGRGSEPARRRPARLLRRRRRAPDRRRGDRGDGAAALARRSRSSRSPTTARPTGLAAGAARAPPDASPSSPAARQRLRPSRAVDARALRASPGLRLYRTDRGRPGRARDRRTDARSDGAT